ncbi:MAG TPA: acyltransferase [Steroidobacteraceae bacterium]|nr:acyltransferase [Steroidobacteraceae bacterium]
MKNLISNSSRANGLDTLRAAAIALVFMNHYMAFVSSEPTFGWGSIVGWTGVDLFFVLSGYLIANQIFSGLARGETLSPRLFYARRALRTLPVFWLVLALYFLFPAFMGGNPPPPLWRFLTFTQNMGLHSGTAFSHAWSLCIEEQFYLILPLVLVAGARLSCRRSQGWALILALLLVGVVTRTALWYSYGPDKPGYYSHIYYATACRFDEFLPGVAIAMLKNFNRPTWQRMTRHGQLWLLAGTLAVATMLYCVDQFYRIDGYGYTFFMTAAGYSLNAMAFSLLVVAALSPNSWLARVRIPGAYQIALWSYSTYLSHKAVQIVLARQLRPFNLPPIALACIIVVTAVLVGALLYWLVESPFMALRDRWFPSNFTAEPARLSGIKLTSSSR